MAKSEHMQFFSYGAGSVPVWTDGSGGYSQTWYTPIQVAPQATPNKLKDSNNSVPNVAVELKVHFCCENCIGRMQIAFHQVDGVKSVDCNYSSGRVTVKGSGRSATLLEIEIFAAAKKVDSRAALAKKRGRGVEENTGHGKVRERPEQNFEAATKTATGASALKEEKGRREVEENVGRVTGSAKPEQILTVATKADSGAALKSRVVK